MVPSTVRPCSSRPSTDHRAKVHRFFERAMATAERPTVCANMPGARRDTAHQSYPLTSVPVRRSPRSDVGEEKKIRARPTELLQQQLALGDIIALVGSPQ